MFGLSIFDFMRIDRMMMVMSVSMIMIDCLINFYSLAKRKHFRLIDMKFILLILDIHMTL